VSSGQRGPDPLNERFGAIAADAAFVKKLVGAFNFFFQQSYIFSREVVVEAVEEAKSHAAIL
jgi:hypothetical protein